MSQRRRDVDKTEKVEEKTELCRIKNNEEGKSKTQNNTYRADTETDALNSNTSALEIAGCHHE